MRPMAVLAMIALSACAHRDKLWGGDGEEPGGDTVVPPDPEPAPTCECVDTPPATYTGPSTFWIGLVDRRDGVPACPATTPLQGVEGPLSDPTILQQFARECRITPSDTCPTEGKVCAPFSTDDYHTCIHHLGHSACPVEYPRIYRMNESETGTPITLCCQPPRISS